MNVHQPPWRSAKASSSAGSAHSSPEFQYSDREFLPTTTPQLTPQVLRQHRQHAYLRRFFQRSEDLPGQGAFRLLHVARLPPPVETPLPRYTETTPGEGRGSGAIGRTDANGIYRASYTSVVTARSSASRMARPSPFSSSARTLARFTGPPCTEGRTRRVSLRLVAIAIVSAGRMIAGVARHDISPHRSPLLHITSHICCMSRDTLLTTLFNRKSPRSVPAAQSSTSVPSSVPRST